VVEVEVEESCWRAGSDRRRGLFRGTTDCARALKASATRLG